MTLVGLSARNALRNPVRLVLTLLGVAFAVMTFVALRTALCSWDQAQQVARRDRVVTRHKVTFILPLPRRYLDEVRQLRDAQGNELASHVTFATWFGGRDPAHPREFFASYAVDAETYLSVYDEIEAPSDQLEHFRNDRGSALVGDQTARKLGWKVGDKVSLESGIYPTPDGSPWTFTIAGIYSTRTKGADRGTLLFHWSRLNDALAGSQRDQLGWIASRATDASRATKLATSIDALFDERDAQTLSQDELAFTTGFLGMVSAVLDVFGVLSMIIAAITALILANAIAMGTRERATEYASLKAMGFPPRAIAQIIVTESVMVAFAGALLGLVMSWWLVGHTLAPFFEENLSSFFPVFRVDPSALISTLGLSLVLGVVAAILPAWATSQAPVTHALRRVA
ncbi:MAG: FtsX-like permease family protein [Polyangiaceae bacterium]